MADDPVTPDTPAEPSEDAEAETPPGDPEGDEPTPEEPALEDEFRDETPMPGDVDAELAAQIDRVAPMRPGYVRTDDDKLRWSICARVAAAVAIDHSNDEAEQRHFAFAAARTLYRDRSIPTGSPHDMGTAAGEDVGAPDTVPA